MENLNTQIFRGGEGGVMEKALKRDELPKKGEGAAWTFCRFIGSFPKKRALLFLRGEKGLIPQCTLILLI